MPRPQKSGHENTYILVVKCPDRKGAVAAGAGFPADNDASILESDRLQRC